MRHGRWDKRVVRVGELVGEQSMFSRRARKIYVGGKGDVMANGKGLGVEPSDWGNAGALV